MDDLKRSRSKCKPQRSFRDYMRANDFEIGNEIVNLIWLVLWENEQKNKC